MPFSYSVVPGPFVGKQPTNKQKLLFLIESFWRLCQKFIAHIWAGLIPDLRFWSFDEVVCPMPIPHRIDYHSFTVSFEMK